MINITGKQFFKSLVILSFIFVFGVNCYAQSQPAWPQITAQQKPWTRWWWMGSAVNKKDLARNLEMLEEANIGGVEITPIYGVAGYENQFINYLSPRWMEMFVYTLQKSDSLGLGVDMATGTGWPFGGPWVGAKHASKNMHFKTYTLSEGEELEERVVFIQEPMLHAIGNTINQPIGVPVSIQEIKEPIAANDSLQALALSQVRFEKPLPLQTLMAYSDDGETLNLTDKVDSNGTLDWIAPAGNWMLYAVFQGWHGKMVERAAPGGEGFAIDYFSKQALKDYLSKFNQAFEDADISSLRAFFNDSYEVDDASGQANWTSGFFEAFEKRRGYDLRKHLPALLRQTKGEQHIRVLTDYRKTMSDLLLEAFTHTWNQWADEKGAMIRNQAHGSPANILDLYAASDIPETEGTSILRAKMASSAAHVTGKPLVAAEAATWLNGHFLSSLGEVKKAVDRFFISGINHIFYHGSAYSPQDARWPGWLFYAAVHFQPTNPFWDHFGSFNQYVARVQSFLQSGQPDNEVLLYYPIYEQWAKPGESLLVHFDGTIDETFAGTVFKKAAHKMLDQGYTFDFISDRQINNAVIEGKTIATKGIAYKTLIIPATDYMPLKTLQNVIQLARNGATIVMYKGIPQDVPGLAHLEKKQTEFKALMNQLKFSDSTNENFKIAKLGQGQVLLGDSLGHLLTFADVDREPMVDNGLRFTRRTFKGGHLYFITNWGQDAVDGWVPLAVQSTSAALYNPMHKQSGYAKIRPGKSGNTEVYLQLKPGESCILKTYAMDSHEVSYNYWSQDGKPISLSGTWSVHFVQGGPTLPEDIETDALTSWTSFGQKGVENFSGKAVYALHFSVDDPSETGWLLNLGEVHESARVWVNGQLLGTTFGPIHQLFVPASLLKDENILKVEVASSMTNRIAYMDRKNIIWKKFYNVNFSAFLSKNRNKKGLFDASQWLPRDSGLMGPVTLTPVKHMK